ncbi:hypothetical protein AQUCO_01400334v1 [Aquilegia coerulea]|uniref:Ureide permease 1-like n=1 Tax=Aquilegia coerulea TaxID=218851 RepID=A0A2G5DVU1_AQUCA|nr:hypothetical protein AQUCO_01400334v1 [Aquilegia coerulea]
MYLVESKGGAIVCMLLAIIFLGTWPAIMNFLERRGRHPQHTNLDDSIASLLVATIIALTIGQIGNSTPDVPNFTTQIFQNNWPCVLFAMAGGIFQGLGNLTTQYAWAFVGLSVTEVITSSIAVVVGTTLNYFLDEQINRAAILFFGVGCFIVAVFLGAAVHFSNAADNEVKLSNVSNTCNEKEKAIEIPGFKKIFPHKDGHKDLEQEAVHAQKAIVGSAEFLRQLENRRAIKVFGKRKLIGLGIAFFSGLCFSLYSPAFNMATNDYWQTMKEGIPHLVVYTAFFYFSVSCSMTTIILNIRFLYHPILNLPKSSLHAYLNDWSGRTLALLAGLLCGLGNGLQFIGGQAAGYAAADSVQALPLVSTLWGIILLGEYRRSSKRTYILLGSMLFMFSVATGLLMASSGQRK